MYIFKIYILKQSFTYQMQCDLSISDWYGLRVTK